MPSGQLGVRSLLLIVWSLLLTAFTAVLGVAPLKVVRRQLGPLPFTLLSVGIFALLWGLKIPALAVLFLVLSVMVGVQSQAEEAGYDTFTSAGLGLIASILTSSGLAYLWILKSGPQWMSLFKAQVDKQLAQFSEANYAFVQALKSDDILTQLPSLILAGLVIAAAMGLILEKPILRWMGMRFYKRRKLTSFKMPDAGTWLVISSLLFAFVDLGWPQVKVVASNALNVALVFYFFQGLAVLCRYFEVFKVSSLWRTIWVVLFSTQLFLVLSAIGFADFWLDFRVYITKRAAELKKRRS